MNVERLRTLEAALRNLDETKKILIMPEGKSPEKFVWDFDTWGELEPSCNTRACAMGLAAFLPEFRDQGLTFKIKPRYNQEQLDHFFAQYGGEKAVEDAKKQVTFVIELNGESFGMSPVTVASEFFDIPYADASDLFVHLPPTDDDQVTELDVADAIKSYIEDGIIPGRIPDDAGLEEDDEEEEEED